MGTSREVYMYALEQKKKKLSQHSNMNGVGIWSNGGVIKGGNFPKNLANDVSSITPSFANASGSGVLTCKALHPFNSTKYEACIKNYTQGSTNEYELEKLRAENERLAIQSASAGSTSMSGGSIALITIGSIAALTGMIILIKKYGK